eukprot:985599-Amphidinium_carterae.1
MNVAGHGDSDGVYLFIWRQSPKELIRVSARGKAKAKTHFRRAEDLSIEMVPNEVTMQENGISSMDFHS